MISSLLDKKTAKLFDKIAKEKALLHQKEEEAVTAFMCTYSKETIYKVLNIVDDNGHPTEKRLAGDLRNKYNTGNLEFDDIITLDMLYKSNYRFFGNKDEQK